MTFVKLKQLTLHNFMHFRHADIKLLDDTTLINGMKQSPEILANFVLAFKFILNSLDISEDEIRRFNDGNDSTNEVMYVEARFLSQTDEIIFRKSLHNSAIIYELNNNLTTREDFKSRLTALGFELSISNTLIIDSQMIYRIAIMNDQSRGDFIEQFCAPPELLARYQRVKDKMEDMQVEMKSLVDQKKEFKASEKKEKTKVNSLKKFKELDRNLHKQTQEYLLFQLYHNQREYFELRPQNIEDLKRTLNALKGDYGNTLMAFRLATENYLMYDRLLVESNGKILDNSNVKFQLEQECERCQQELMLLELQSTNNFEDLYLHSVKNEVEKNNQKMQEFQALKAKLEPSYAEYNQLRKALNSKNLKLMTYFNTLKKLVISDINEMEESQKFFQAQLQDLKSEEAFYANKLVSLKDRQVEIEEEVTTCNEHSKELETRFNVKKNMIAKFENAMSSFLGTKKSNARRVLEKLQNKFSHSVVGRLCDLFDVKACKGIEVKRFQILERLGKFAEAIVVDSQEVADNCVEFLKLQQHQDIKEVVIPLTICKDTSTIEVMKNLKLPDGIVVEPIESFIIAKHPEIHKLLMHLLKPTLVCTSLINAQNIFAAVDMKIQVTSFECHTTYKPGGIIQIHLRNVEQSDFDDETLMLIKENLQESHLEIIELSAEMKMNDLKWVGYENKRRTFEYYSRLVASLKESNLDAMKFGLKKVSDSAKIIGRLKNVQGLDELKKKYHEIKETLRPIEASFFNDFLLKYNYKTIDDYELELSKVYPESVYKSRLNFFVARQEFYEKTRTKLLQYAPGNELEDFEKAKDRSDKAKELHDKSIENLETIKMENARINESMKESLKKTLEKRAEFNELERKIESKTEKLCDEYINIQIAIAENYRLLFFALADCDKVPLKKGSLMKLLDIPNDEDIGEDFDLMQWNLEGLEINFEKLDNKLKSDLDIPKKKIEMSKKLGQLKVSLDEFALDVTGDEEHLHNLTQRLNRLIAETRKLTQDIQDVTEEFQNVGNERTRRFNECLEVINREIGKFGTIAMRGKTHGELKADNINEPYASEIYYTWRMDKHEMHVNDLNLNYEAAFAFLMGLIKYKKQQFVILSDSAKVMLNDFDLKSLLDYLKSDENFQIVAILASKIKHIEEYCSCSIMKRQDRCIVLSNL